MVPVVATVVVAAVVILVQHTWVGERLYPVDPREQKYRLSEVVRKVASPESFPMKAPAGCRWFPSHSTQRMEYGEACFTL